MLEMLHQVNLALVEVTERAGTLLVLKPYISVVNICHCYPTHNNIYVCTHTWIFECICMLTDIHG